MRQDEDLRKQLTILTRDDSPIFSQRIKRRKDLKRLEEKVMLMDTKWDEFCLLVCFKSSVDSLSNFSLQFPDAYYQCEMAAQKAGNRKKEMVYKRKATEASASISRIFETLLEEEMLRNSK